MGQAMSLTELEQCVHQAFSDQLLISCALLPSPYLWGTHVKCEVDVARITMLTGWLKGDPECVIQLVKTCSSRSMESGKVDNGKDTEEKVEKEAFSLRCGLHDEESKSIQENMDCSSIPTDCPGVNKEEQSFQSMDNEDLESFQETVDSSSEFCDRVSLLLSLLAPNVIIEDASFKTVVNMLYRWVSANKNVSVPRSSQHRVLGTEYLSSKILGDKNNSDFLLQSANAKVSHPNIVPLLGVCRTANLLFLIYPAIPSTLETILHFSPKVLDDEWDIRFLVYQLLSAAAFYHALGIVHGDLKPSNILLTDKIWCWVTGFHADISGNFRNKSVEKSLNDQNSYMREALLAESHVSQRAINGVRSAFILWYRGELTNYDYLLFLNKLAGRRWGDRKFHIVMPWVIDFTVRPDKITEHGWRDLTKSKWRLAKGDEQLDFTYSTAEAPHHVSDECLSELAVCIYKARRLPLFILRQSVRSVYEPNEYPATLQRLYQWTPDECIPEFYTEPSVFTSIHPEMSDLAVPSWAKSAEDFISWHRQALEGKHVSDNLHHWIDLTFGYKLSGEAAIYAKNVALPAVNPMLPQSQGRRQLFTVPHPKRKQGTTCIRYNSSDGVECHTFSMDTGNGSCTTNAPQQCLQTVNSCMKPQDFCVFMSLDMLEEVNSFCESFQNLSPIYTSSTDLPKKRLQDKKSQSDLLEHYSISMQDLPNPSKFEKTEFQHDSLAELLQALKVDSVSEGTFQDYELWKNKAVHNNTLKDGAGCDIFALGCIMAEVYLGRPLFNQNSLHDFEELGMEPAIMQHLPAHAQSLVRLMIEKNPVRKISAAFLLESPFFPPTVRAVHTFVSSLYLMEDQQARLEFVARLASHGAFILMGPLAARKCLSFCLSPLVLLQKEAPVQECLAVLTAAFLALKPNDANLLLIPVIQKLLQGDGNHELKVALLQISFARKIFKCVGIAVYLKLVHPVVLSVLQQSGDGALGAAASIFLIESCEDLGLPITCSHTIGPLLQQFGRDVSVFAIDTVVGIGKRLGECLVVRHLLPSLRAMIAACLKAVSKERSGPARSWRMMVMHDALEVLEHFLSFLPSTTVFSSLVQEPHNVIESLLLHSGVDDMLRQHAAKTLLSICQCVGPDATAGHILPRLQPLFAVLIFDHLSASSGDLESLGSASSGTSLDVVPYQTKTSIDYGTRSFLKKAFSSNSLSSLEKSNSQLNLVRDLYIGLASILGVERLRQCLSTWLILEQLLLKIYGWKWETADWAHQGKLDKLALSMAPFGKTRAEFSPTILLVNEIGWSVPQSSLSKGKHVKGEDNIKPLNAASETGIRFDCGQWGWIPLSKDYWEDTDYLSRTGLFFNTAKEECTWNVKAIVSHAWRAHPGPIKAVAVGDGETTIFTAGVGTKMRGLVKQWQLSTIQSIMDYSGHEEAVNEICVLPWRQRLASCDGSIRLWDIQTADCVAVFSESSISSSSAVLMDNRGLSSVGPVITSATTVSGGTLFTGLHDNHYTCMHVTEMEEKLVAGTGNGQIRFFDLHSGKSLHLWRCDLDPSGPSLVSSITSSRKQFTTDSGSALPSSWIAVGFGLGVCRLLDSRIGNFVCSWRAHEGFITKLAAFDDHYLISSSLDKTLCLWDLRRNAPAQLQVFHGHSHGILSFQVLNNKLISAGGNKIGISTLSYSTSESQDCEAVRCHKLFPSDLSSLNMSSITAIDLLPFSKFFIAGSDDGYLRVCK